MAKRSTVCSKKANNNYDNLNTFKVALDTNKLGAQSKIDANVDSVCFVNNFNQQNQQINETDNQEIGAMDFMDISEYSIGNDVKEEYHGNSMSESEHITDESEQIEAIKRFLQDPSVGYIESTNHSMDNYYNPL